MTRVAMLTLCLTLSGAWSGGAGAAAIATEAPETQQPTTPASTPGITIRYHRGAIEAEISDAPLGQVARELEAQTQTRVILTDPASASWGISAFVKANSFGEGIRQILNGYSYVIYPVGAETPVIVVLSTRRNLPTPAADAVAQGPVSSAVLQSAEEVEALAESEADLEAGDLSAEEEDHDPDAVTSLTAEQQQEALLTKALAMLKSNNRQLHAQAMDQLVGIDDPRATQALIRAATGDRTTDPRSRVQAVESLWNHAADLGFSDQAAVNALRQLATDRDTNVRDIARQALVDMQHQQETLMQAMQK